jgi:hypothetical protein
MPDVKRLIAEVANRNGIRLDPDDPAFCIVTLNQLLLEEAGEKFAADVREATKEFEDSVRDVEGRIGAILGRQLKQTLMALREMDVTDRPKVNRQHRALAVGICVLSAVIVFAGGVAVGMALH